MVEIKCYVIMCYFLRWGRRREIRDLTTTFFGPILTIHVIIWKFNCELGFVCNHVIIQAKSFILNLTEKLHLYPLRAFKTM